MAQERREVEVTIKCQCDGFGFDLAASLEVGHIPGLIQKLRDAGVEPAFTPYAGTMVTNGKGALSNSHNDAPLCPVHGVAMKPSTKGGGWFCSRKIADGSYCREKVAS